MSLASAAVATAAGPRAGSRELFFEEAFLRKLDRLRITSQRMHASGIHGGRRSRKRGTSVEFADYREYTPGDDLRQIDWNIYGRSDRLYVKLREDEESLPIHVLLDCSRSMDWGRANKFALARRLAAALAYVGLSALDNVAVYPFAAQLLPPFPLTSGRAQALRLFAFVAQLEPAGQTDVRHALRSFAALHRRSGIALILSDLMSSGVLEGINAVLDRGHEVALLHVLDRRETDPELGGEVELVDRETGRVISVSVDRVTLEHYKLRLARWMNEIAEFCGKRMVNYVPITSGAALDDVLFRQLRMHRVLE